MKKLFAMMLALAMLLTCVSAFAEDDVVTLKIAHIGPLHGDVAVYGNATSNGGQIAADQINAAGGKYRVEYVTYDDLGDAEEAVKAFNRALQDKAQVILGTTTTSPCIAVGTEAYEERVFMLTPSASATAVTADKDNVYQVCFTDPNQGIASANFIAQNGLPTKVGIIYNNGDPYSSGIYETFLDEAQKLNLEVVYEGAFNDDTTEFAPYLDKAIGENKAELIFLPIYYEKASLILKAAADAEYAPVWFGVDGMDGILDIEGFDKSLAENVLLLTPFFANAQDEKTQTFVSTYQAQYGGIPNQFAADAYDGVYALVAAAEKASVQNGETYADICDRMIAAMQEISVEGLTGTMSWSANGEVTKIPSVVVIKDGAYASFGE